MTPEPPKPKDMAELRTEKAIMEETLRSIISKFEQRTGCVVDEVVMNRIYSGDGHLALGHLHTEVRL